MGGGGGPGGEKFVFSEKAIDFFQREEKLSKSSKLNLCSFMAKSAKFCDSNSKTAGPFDDCQMSIDKPEPQ